MQCMNRWRCPLLECTGETIEMAIRSLRCTLNILTRFIFKILKRWLWIFFEDYLYIAFMYIYKTIQLYDFSYIYHLTLVSCIVFICITIWVLCLYISVTNRFGLLLLLHTYMWIEHNPNNYDNKYLYSAFPFWVNESIVLRIYVR